MDRTLISKQGFNPMQVKALGRIREELDFSFGLVFTDEDWDKTVEIMRKEYGDANKH